MIFKRRVFDKISQAWMVTALVTILLLPPIIAIGLYAKSIPLLAHQSFYDLIFSSDWAPNSGKFGFFSFITGSVYVTLYAFIFSAPLCLFAAIYLTQFGTKTLLKVMHPVIDILAGLPSVIYGVWGLLVVVPFVSFLAETVFGINTAGYSLLAGALVLAVMCIPYMMNMLIEVFNAVPKGLKEASLALGATHWETVKHVVLRKSFSGIISSFGLSVSKAFGETIAVMMVVGNTIKLTHNPFDPGYPLPALIANNYGEMLSIPLYDSALMFAAFLLLIIILAINLLFRFFIYKTQKV
jgi:phosphate transport system permease protein